MSAQAVHANLPNDPGPQATDAQYYRQALHGLIDMGTGLARLLYGQATVQAEAAQPAPTPQATAQPVPIPAQPALVGIAAAFDKVARTVRRCILLAQALDKPAPDPARHRAAARKRILREVEDVIQRPHDGESPEDPETLHAELRDRLDAPDLDGDIATRPIPDIINEICRDLGLSANPGTRPFKRRTPADVAHLNARATAPANGRQPGAGPQAPSLQAASPQAFRPQAPGCGAPQPTPASPNGHAAGPAEPHTPCPQPAPVRTGSILPDDPAEAIAAILRPTTRAEARWRPPLTG